MRKNLIFGIIIAIFAAIFASKNPDGLDKVSKLLGFAEKGKENAALFSGYNIHFLGNSTISTIVAGILGVMLTYALFLLIIFAVKKCPSCNNKS